MSLPRPYRDSLGWQWRGGCSTRPGKKWSWACDASQDPCDKTGLKGALSRIVWAHAEHDLNRWPKSLPNWRGRMEPRCVGPQ
eukprot:9968169-Alexandrium_andersonii.AAC.1